MIRLRTIAALMLAPLLGSCSYLFHAKAFFLDGHLAFVSEDVGLDPATCPNMLRVIDGQGRIVWEVDPERWSLDGRCKEGSPLKYGAVPKGAKVEHGPEKLRTGIIYVFDGGFGGSRIKGAFTLYRGGGKLVLRNLPTDSDEVVAILNDANWRDNAGAAAN